MINYSTHLPFEASVFCWEFVLRSSHKSLGVTFHVGVCVSTRSLDLNLTSAVIQESLSCTFSHPLGGHAAELPLWNSVQISSRSCEFLRLSPPVFRSVCPWKRCMCHPNRCSNTSWPLWVVHHNHSPQLIVSEQPCWDWSVLLNSSSLIAIGEQEYHSPYLSRLSSRFKNWTVWFLSAGQVYLPDCVYFFRLRRFSSLLSVFPAHLVCHKTTHLVISFCCWLMEDLKEPFSTVLHHYLSRLCRCTQTLALEKKKKKKKLVATAPVGVFSGWHFCVIKILWISGSSGKKWHLVVLMRIESSALWALECMLLAAFVVTWFGL